MLALQSCFIILCTNSFSRISLACAMLPALLLSSNRIRENYMCSLFCTSQIHIEALTCVLSSPSFHKSKTNRMMTFAALRLYQITTWHSVVLWLLLFQKPKHGAYEQRTEHLEYGRCINTSTNLFILFPSTTVAALHAFKKVSSQEPMSSALLSLVENTV